MSASEYIPLGFKPVVGFPGYCVDTSGNVLSRKSGEWVKKSACLSKGYRGVLLSRDGKACYRRVHLLVLGAFVGPKPIGSEARHMDNDKTFNFISNLSWGSRNENLSDSHFFRGEHNGNTPLSAESVAVIRQMLNAGDPTRKIASLFSVTQQTVRKIGKRKTWA